jgi:outer membrane protein TolC
MRLRLLFSLLAFSSCLERSIAGDVADIRAEVSARSQLDLPPLEAEAGDEDEAAVAKLLSVPLTAEAAEQLALLNNHNLRAALRRLPRGALVQAGLLPNPTFNAEVRISQQAIQPPQWDLDVGYSLSRLLLRGNAVAAAAKDLDAAKLEAARQVLDLAFGVRAAVLAVQAEQAKVELARTAERAAQASCVAAHVLFDAGNLALRELALYQADCEEARLMRLSQESDLTDLQEQAAMLMGLHGQSWSVAPLPDVPAGAPPELLESKALEANLLLAEQRTQLEAIAHRIGYTKLDGVLPDISIAVHAERDAYYWEVGPAVSGRLPLFDRNQGRVLTLEAELAAQKESYVATAVEVRSAVRAARSRALAAAARAQSHREVLAPLRRRVVEETLKSYNALHVGVFVLLEARRAELATARASADASLEYWRARAALDTLLAGEVVHLKERSSP